MKQIIIIATLSLVATVWAIPNEKCRPTNLPNATFEDCCPLGFDLIPKEVFQKCEAAFPMPPPPPPPAPGTIPGPPRGCCMSECILKELKIFNDGKLNKDAAKSYLTTAVKAKPELKAIVEAAVEKCATEGESKKAFFEEGAKLPPIPPSNQTCSMISGFMIGCVHAEILMNCPSLTQKQECTDLKTFATDCKFIMPKKKPAEKAN